MKTTAQTVLDEVENMERLERAAEATETAQTQGFNAFDLPEKLMQSLRRMNFTAPTPIQAQTIPLAMEGKDILGSAQTGTGKTGAFGIPLVAKLIEDPRACALVMTPTRELATQVLAALQQMIPIPTIKTALLIGGESMPKQFKQLQMRPRLVVGTPGRINDHLNRHTLDLRHTRFLVLDETDRMLDMGFGVQIDKILAYMPNDNRQTLMFSATLPPSIVKISQKYMTDATRIAVGSTTTPAAKIKTDVLKVKDGEKHDHLMKQLEMRDGSIIIFVRTKHGADRMADKLCRAGYEANAIHGDLQQRKRDRVIQSFRDKEIRILVATDVAARGLDIPHIEHVINYDLPQVPEDYIHRIGRTARAGAEGCAVNFVAPSEANKWKAIQRLIHDGESDEDSFVGKGKRQSSGASQNKKPYGKKDYGDNQWKDRKPSGDRQWQERQPSRDNQWQDRRSPRQEYANENTKPRNRYSEDRFDNMFDDQPRRMTEDQPRKEPRFGGFGAGRKDGRPSAPRSAPRSDRFDRPERSERSERTNRSDARPSFGNKKREGGNSSMKRGGGGKTFSKGAGRGRFSGR